MSMALRTKILLGAAATIATYVFMGPNDVQTVEAAKNTANSGITHVVQAARTHRQNPARALYLLAHRVSADGSAQSLFAAHSWYAAPPPPPPPPAPELTAAEEAALRAPVAPPLPFTYMGSYTPDGSAPVFFLTQGDRVYNVRIGDTLNDTYTVDSITGGQLVMTYKPLNIKQQLTVGSAQ